MPLRLDPGADVRWQLRRLRNLIARYTSLPRVSIPTALPIRYSEVARRANVAVPMRDQVNLATDIYLPRGVTQPLPTVLIRMPYGKDDPYCYLTAHGAYWARQGYACVIQDVRGKWGSEGTYQPFIHEADDGWDTLDWIAAQPWSDGRVAMTGESYYGYTQWAVAPLGHPALKCIAPGNTAANIYGVWFYVNGALALQTIGAWSIYMAHRRYQNYYRLHLDHLPVSDIDTASGTPSAFWREMLAHPTRDGYWDAINVDQRYDRIAIPVLSWGGWYDVFLKGTIDDWLGLRAQSPKPDNHFLLIAPTDHEMRPWRTGKIGRVIVGDDVWSYDWIAQFFDRFLRGTDNGWEEGGNVRYFTMGANTWRQAADFPPAGVQLRSWYLQPDGGLSLTLPAADAPPSQYTYDPLNPVNSAAQTDLWYFAETLPDRRLLDSRDDMLRFTSQPLPVPIEITGHLSLTLYASSSAPDTDFTAALVQIFPDGYAHLIQEGIIRASFRDMPDGVGTPTSLIPGQITRFTIDLWATSIVVPAGHRLRVEIASSNFDRYDRNLNTGEPATFGMRSTIATQTIYHDSNHPSALLLPTAL